MAQSIASWQDGIVGMTDDLVVLSPAAAKSDDNLKEVIGDLLRKEFILENNVRFDVKDGIVHLYGTAKSLWAKYHIQESIQRILGVKDVINEINVESGSN
jgi:osmotically-inducible protein OsmY